ncbi:MAG: hypothetical protein QM756_16370 [Polyangiaceae bacterium]
MKYMLVLQWPALGLQSLDALVEIEDTLRGSLARGHAVDGHDMGTGEANIFIVTKNPRAAFSSVRDILSGNDCWRLMRSGYRSLKTDEYSPLWPEALDVFDVN